MAEPSKAQEKVAALGVIPTAAFSLTTSTRVPLTETPRPARPPFFPQIPAQAPKFAQRMGSHFSLQNVSFNKNGKSENSESKKEINKSHCTGIRTLKSEGRKKNANEETDGLRYLEKAETPATPTKGPKVQEERNKKTKLGKQGAEDDTTKVLAINAVEAISDELRDMPTTPREKEEKFHRSRRACKEYRKNKEKLTKKVKSPERPASQKKQETAPKEWKQLSATAFPEKVFPTLGRNFGPESNRKTLRKEAASWKPESPRDLREEEEVTRDTPWESTRAEQRQQIKSLLKVEIRFEDCLEEDQSNELKEEHNQTAQSQPEKIRRPEEKAVEMVSWTMDNPEEHHSRHAHPFQMEEEELRWNLNTELRRTAWAAEEEPGRAWMQTRHPARRSRSNPTPRSNDPLEPPASPLSNRSRY